MLTTNFFYSYTLLYYFAEYKTLSLYELDDNSKWEQFKWQQYKPMNQLTLLILDSFSLIIMCAWKSLLSVSFILSICLGLSLSEITTTTTTCI